MRILTNIVPRRRDKQGNPIPRRYAYARPVITTDPRALIETAEAVLESPESAPRQMGWLRARNAVAADANCERLRLNLELKREERSAKLQTEIAAEQQKVEAVDCRLEKLLPEAAALCASLGVVFRAEEPSFVFHEDEPVSLDELSGELRTPLPKERSRLGSALLKLAALLSGGLLGISLGLLSGKLVLERLSDAWPQLVLWSFLGVCVIALVGAVQMPLATLLGSAMERHAQAYPESARRRILAMGIIVALFAAGFVVIESRIEQLGLFRAVIEETTLQSFALSRTDLGVVSLVLSVPVILFYVVTGVCDGVNEARRARLVAARSSLRKALRAAPAFHQAVRLHQSAHLLLRKKQVLENRIAELSAGIREDLTIEERYRIEDMEHDAAAASYAAEDALCALCPAPTGSRRLLWLRHRLFGESS